MIRLEEKYQQAVNFRKRGFTYSEIAKIVGVSKSTVSAWLSKKAFSKKVKKENAERAARENVKRIGLLNKARKNERTARYAEAIRSAETEYVHYKQNPLFIAGLMLYVADGDHKDTSRMRVSSTNAELHRIYILFTQTFLGVETDDISFWIALYPAMDEKKCMQWWSRSIRLSVTHFGKTQYLTGNKASKTLHHGSGNTIIGNTVLKKKLIRWIELVSKELR